jgi:hypothetical protein
MAFTRRRRGMRSCPARQRSSCSSRKQGRRRPCAVPAILGRLARPAESQPLPLPKTPVTVRGQVFRWTRRLRSSQWRVCCAFSSGGCGTSPALGSPSMKNNSTRPNRDRRSGGDRRAHSRSGRRAGDSAERCPRCASSDLERIAAMPGVSEYHCHACDESWVIVSRTRDPR